MTEQERPKKTTVTIALPRTFYKKYYDLHLYNDYGSFNDMVRCATRDLLRNLEVRNQVREQDKEDRAWKAAHQ